MQREFTGKDMLTVMVVGFGIVIAVNFLMATFATRGFGGVIVENTYVASQKYNGWLEEARAQEALGWQADVIRGEDGHLLVTLAGAPEFTKGSALLRRPLGPEQRQEIDFAWQANGTLRSLDPVAEGRWLVRLQLEAGADSWAREIAIR